MGRNNHSFLRRVVYKKNSPPHDHTLIHIPLFHLFRIVALAFMLFSSAFFIRFHVAETNPKQEHLHKHQGRNYLMLGAVFFLMGEYVGILWCQAGWGDFWRWSEGFFQSTFIVLYFMLALHIPVKGRRSEAIKSLVGATSGFIMLILMIIRSFS